MADVKFACEISTAEILLKFSLNEISTRLGYLRSQRVWVAGGPPVRWFIMFLAPSFLPSRAGAVTPAGKSNPGMLVLLVPFAASAALAGLGRGGGAQ